MGARVLRHGCTDELRRGGPGALGVGLDAVIHVIIHIDCDHFHTYTVLYTFAWVKPIETQASTLHPFVRNGRMPDFYAIIKSEKGATNELYRRNGFEEN